MKPDYINKDIKKVDPEHLKQVLKELHEKHKAERRQAQIDLSKALSDGFRCINAK